jgi:hypothetical protein
MDWTQGTFGYSKALWMYVLAQRFFNSEAGAGGEWSYAWRLQRGHRDILVSASIPDVLHKQKSGMISFPKGLCTPFLESDKGERLA